MIKLNRKTNKMIYGLLSILFFMGCQKQQNIDSYLVELNKDGKLNGNVLVMKDDSIYYEQSFGYADVDKTKELTKDHRFNIGSIYKEFPAVAIMMLQEEEKLEVDDKLSKHIDDLPAWSQDIKIKNLLQYSSGLPLVPWNKFFETGEYITDGLLLKALNDIEVLEFEPGKDYLYSNYNPLLLIKIVENITNRDFNNYVEESILKPYGMTGTVIKEQYPYLDKTLTATPFNTDFEEDEYKMAIRSFLLTSTARDMAKWFQDLGDFKIISRESVRTLSEEAKEGYNIQAPLGRCDWENNQLVEHFHHGSNASYECVIRRFKQEGITIAILTNQKNGNVNEISEVIYNMVR